MKIGLLLIGTLTLASCEKQGHPNSRANLMPNVDQARIYVGIDRVKNNSIRIHNAGEEPISFSSRFDVEWKNAEPTSGIVAWEEALEIGCGNYGTLKIGPGEIKRLGEFSIEPYLNDVNHKKFHYRIGINVSGYNDDGDFKLKRFWSDAFYYEMN